MPLTWIKTEARVLALQVDLAIVHVSALPGQWWPIFGQKQGWVGEELRKKGCSRIILKVGIISPALQMKMVSSKVTSSLSRPSEATRSPTSRRLMSRCKWKEIKQGQKEQLLYCELTNKIQKWANWSHLNKLRSSEGSFEEEQTRPNWSSS